MINFLSNGGHGHAESPTCRALIIEMGFGGDMTSVKTLVFDNPIASWLSRGDGFGCSICDSPALAYPIRLKDDEPVACGRCGEFVSTYGDLKKQFENVLTSNRTSGC
jgi:hypothetical protein